MQPRGRDERGVSLAEILAALAVMAVATPLVLGLFERAHDVFKTAENAAESQQDVRAAFDRLVSDLRMAGFNQNPDGSVLRPDEAIEAAYDTAVVMRGDLDGWDPGRAADPEATLAGGAFATVSTGNDEIVAYALATPGAGGGQTLVFEADVAEPVRDGDVESVGIGRMALAQDAPPYTLYRITLNNDASTYGTGRFVVRTPVVENVRALRFVYYDEDGSVINDRFDLGTTADDIGGGDDPAARAQRSRIRRIGVELEGMTRDPDAGWVDRDDADPRTAARRKFVLGGEVVPRNLGMRGERDLLPGGHF